MDESAVLIDRIGGHNEESRLITERLEGLSF